MLRRAALFLSLAGIVHCDGCRRGPDPSAASEDAATTSAKPAMRSPAEIRRDGNHLVGQASLYLTQHAHNPVDWYPWTPETLARAKSLGRPVFLSIGYSSCHWCHVMEREVFEDDEVASVLNEEFVAIKVDREERPDVDATFMDALQAMNGSGGWPASLFLTPDLEPFFGGTYFPKAEFLSVVRRAAKELKESGASLAQRGAELRDRIAQSHAAVAAGDKVRLGEIEAVARQSLTRFDEVNGGFRGRTKFPNASSWRFLLHAARRWGAPFEAPVKQTLDAMATGGLFDHIGGGFFRYATEPTWSVPHFEKMLYANAALASLYIEAWAAFGEPRYRTAARATLDFLLREMQDGLGGFYASLDADSDGKEGAFYVFTAGEMKTVLGDAAAPAAMKAFGATNTGNFEGANVLTLRPPASPESPGVADATLKLFLARAPRVHPRRDDKLVTAWNGLAIEALARGHAAFGDVRYLTAASQAADRLWTLHRPNGRLVRTSTAGRTGGDAMLDDYATFAAGLIALSEASGGSRETNPEPLGHALELLAEVQRDFGHPNGGFYASRATDSDGGAPLARRIDPYDGEEPCGSSVILATLLRAAALTGRPELYAAVDKGLAASAESARRSGLSMASFLDAALLEAAPFYDVVLAGTPGTPGTPGALDLAYKRAAPAWSVRVEVPAAGPTPRQQALLPATEGKVARGGTATAYVCIRGACKEPTTDPAKLRAQLLDGWQR